MRRRLLAPSIAVVVALVTGSGLAVAGGWAVTSVDTAPEEIAAGRTYTIEYTVRQHGDKPVAVDDTYIQYTSAMTGEVLKFPGRPMSDVGRYSAEVSLPASGEWDWQVSQGWFGVQELGAVQVTEPGSGAGFWTSSTARVILPAAAVLAVLLLVVQVVWVRREGRVDRRGFEPLPGVASGD